MNVFKPSFKVLKQFYREPDKNLKLILSHFLDRDTGSAHAGITRTVYGVVRNEGVLDYIITAVSTRKPAKMETDVLIVLRIAIYLLIFSDSYPDYAVVNEAVQSVRGRAKGFVNAVLRKCSGEKERIGTMGETIKELDIRYSMSPVSMDHLRMLAADTGSDADTDSRLLAYLDYLNREPVFHIRVNTKDFLPSEVKAVLADDVVELDALKPFFSFEVRGPAAPLMGLLKHKKYFYFQDTASQMVSIITSHYAKEAVLDCCAAPGTKSVTLSLLRPELKIYANDINARRIMLLNDFLVGYGLQNIYPLVSDVKRLGLGENVDFVILDAPCTSSGTVRKNPDLKLKIDKERVKKNAREQYEILKSVIHRFPRAYILYSVCSFIKDETEDVLKAVIEGRVGESSGAGMEVVDLSGFLDDYGFNYKKGEYGYYLLPDEVLNNDLFYLCLICLRRPGGAF
jgi:16S rRNA (cytosine967-C5)-methyltransferase